MKPCQGRWQALPRCRRSQQMQWEQQRMEGQEKRAWLRFHQPTHQWNHQSFHRWQMPRERQQIGCQSRLPFLRCRQSNRRWAKQHRSSWTHRQESPR
ncbi:hypothetical protein BC567DRAFT_218879 [Phyllosticta citribraziliensis]